MLIVQGGATRLGSRHSSGGPLVFTVRMKMGSSPLPLDYPERA
jgi:hypothetical protein